MGNNPSVPINACFCKGKIVSIGPMTTISRKCFDCEACQTERYVVQGDSGRDVYCAHPSFTERRYIGDTRDTPSWCPAEPETPSSSAALLQRAEKSETERNALLKIVHFARRVFTSHDDHVNDDQLIALMNSAAEDAKRWQFLMTEPDGFDMHVREYDDDGDEMWIGCYPAADLEVIVDAARANGGAG